MKRKTVLRDITGKIIYENDIIAEGALNKIIWDGAAIVSKRPIGRVVILSDQELDEYPIEDLHIELLETGVARLTGDAPEHFWNFSSEEGDVDLYLNTYDGLYQFQDDIMLEVIEPEIRYSGFHGSCEWTIDSYGHLRIYPGQNGFGILDNTSEVTYTTWHMYADMIKSIVIEDGVSSNADASFLFYKAKNCETIDARGLNTINTFNFNNMFAENQSLHILRQNFDTKNANTMSALFFNCEKLAKVDISSWVVDNVSDVSCMLTNCKAINSEQIAEKEFKNTNHIFGQCAWPNRRN